MKKLNLLEDVGKSIIKTLHFHSDRVSLDDAEYIPIIKKIINAIANQLNSSDFSKNEISEIKKTLKQYARDLYAKAWIKNKLEEETVDEAREIGKEYFDYVYRHGRHPE